MQHQKQQTRRLRRKIMDDILLHIVNEKAKRLNLEVHPDFGGYVDDYFTKTDELHLNDADKKIVATYLTIKAFNIAKTEGKTILDNSDLKAAMWHFHEPKDLHDLNCKRAAMFILAEYAHGRFKDSLPEEFKTYLEDELHA